MKAIFVLFLFYGLSQNIGVNAQTSTDSCVVVIPSVVTVKCGSVLQRDFDLEVYSNCEPTSFLIQVYNRWGEMLFESTTISKWFDMTKFPDGVFVYIVKVDFGEGIKEIKGYVTKLN